MTTCDLVFVSGKGGTGKSAVSAAIAIERARSGQRVLAIDMGQSTGLAAHLRRADLRYRPVETRPGLFAMVMDRATGLDEYLKLQLRLPQGAPTRQIAGALSVLADTAPGVREIISIGKPVYEAWRDVWDAVVVDAPSLGQFQSYLRAPTTIAELVPGGNVRRQADRLARTLEDPSVTKVVFVCTPSELPVRETVESIESLLADNVCPPPMVILNRWLEASGIAASDLDGLPAGSARDAATLQVSMELEQDLWAREIDHDLELPFLRGVLTPGEVAVQLADAIEEPR